MSPRGCRCFFQTYDPLSENVKFPELGLKTLLVVNNLQFSATLQLLTIKWCVWAMKLSLSFSGEAIKIYFINLSSALSVLLMGKGEYYHKIIRIQFKDHCSTYHHTNIHYASMLGLLIHYNSLKVVKWFEIYRYDVCLHIYVWYRCDVCLQIWYLPLKGTDLVRFSLWTSGILTK